MADNKLECIGYVKVDIDTIREWLEEEKVRMSEKTHSSRLDEWEDVFRQKGLYHQYGIPGSSFPNDGLSTFFEVERAELLKTALILEDESQRFSLYHINDEYNYAVIGYTAKKYVVPPCFIAETEMLKDYSYLTADEISALTDSEITSSSFLPAGIEGESRVTLQQKLQEEKDKIEAEKAKFNLKVEEIREAARKKEEELRALLAAEQGKLEAAKREIENKLLVLETQIYGIRCYLGEVIDFTPISTGKHADENEPIVLFQKIRFLDEEMGKYMSLFEFGEHSGDDKTLVQILKHRSDIRDIFCPSERCVAVLKNSRNGVGITVSGEFANAMERYEYAHGNQISILVRDGENLYIGWTEENKVTLSSEDMFMKPGQTSVQDDDKIPSESEIERQARRELSNKISRYFLLSIVQGIIDNGNLINIPPKTKVTAESDLVKFSFAEGWIQDTSYGTFEDILKETTKPTLKQGEMLYTLNKCMRDDYYSNSGGWRSSRYAAYNNDRGIGERNRTHDAVIPYATLMPINKILKRCKVNVTINLLKPVLDNVTDKQWYRSKVINMKPSEEVMCTFTKDIDLDEDDFNKAETVTNLDKVIKVKFKPWRSDDMKYDEVLFKLEPEGWIRGGCRSLVARYDEVEGCDDEGLQNYFYKKYADYGFPQITINSVSDESTLTYVSVDSDSYSGGESKVNMHIYSDEYLRASYLCSTWIKYVITTRNVGRVGSATNYAQMLPYLKTLLEFTTKQEQEYKQLIIEAGGQEWLEKNPKWDLELCKWRIENSVPTLSIGYAKRFVKSVTKK